MQYSRDNDTYNNFQLDVSIPVVLIVCEGGIGTLDQAYNAIVNGVPVVVVVGSGRAAEVIATAYKLTGWKYKYQLQHNRFLK